MKQYNSKNITVHILILVLLLLLELYMVWAFFRVSVLTSFEERPRPSPHPDSLIVAINAFHYRGNPIPNAAGFTYTIAYYYLSAFMLFLIIAIGRVVQNLCRPTATSLEAL